MQTKSMSSVSSLIASYASLRLLASIVIFPFGGEYFSDAGVIPCM